MSDLLIKNTAMPQGCRQCYFKKWTNSRAGWFCPLRHKFLSRRVIIQDKRYDDCPLVEVPSHGRLIDADSLKDNINIYFFPVIGEIIDSAPTIIEEENSNDG